MHGFALSRDAGQLPRVDDRMGEWNLAVAPHLPITRLLAEDGAEIGWILGWTIDPREKRLITGEKHYALRGRSLAQFHEDEIRPLAGTYLAILSIAGETRITLDGLGNLSCVFDPDRQIAAGTAADFMDESEYAARLDHELYRQMEIAREGWFPAGLTAHRGLERLMANHFLDCDKWCQFRHNSYANAEPVDPAEAFAAIADEIAIPINGALQSGRSVTIGLTGGGDSRLLLAGCKDFVDRVGFYTVATPGKSTTSFDVIRASELARRFDLRHTVLPYVSASDDEATAWDHRVGDCVVTNNRRQHPSVYPLEQDICIGGLGGEVGRCFLWPNMTQIPVISAVGMVDLLKLPRVPHVIDRIEAWLDDLQEEDPFRLLDLAYIELRMASWSSVQSYANPRSTIIHPLASFRSIEAMLRLPPETRQRDGLISGFVRQFWPELLTLPINRYGDYRDVLQPLHKATNPVKLFRKIRQLLRT